MLEMDLWPCIKGSVLCDAYVLLQFFIFLSYIQLTKVLRQWKSSGSKDFAEKSQRQVLKAWLMATADAEDALLIQSCSP